MTPAPPPPAPGPATNNSVYLVKKTNKKTHELVLLNYKRKACEKYTVCIYCNVLYKLLNTSHFKQ